jgi:hypothetical protein
MCIRCTMQNRNERHCINVCLLGNVNMSKYHINSMQ